MGGFFELKYRKERGSYGAPRGIYARVCAGSGSYETQTRDISGISDRLNTLEHEIMDVAPVKIDLAPIDTPQ